MAFTEEEPIVSRLDRLDIMLRHLEEMKGSSNRSPRSSYASTPSSGVLTTSDGAISSLNSSPKSSLEKHCRPINTVVMETEIKGNLIDRIIHAEDRLLKLCVQLEEEHKKKLKEEKGGEEEKNEKKEHKKRGLKQLVKSCVRGKPKTTKNH